MAAGGLDKINDEAAARVFGLQRGVVTVLIRCGSRGRGHQVCPDHMRDTLREETGEACRMRPTWCAWWKGRTGRSAWRGCGRSWW
jgi:RNA-splicing ligase RtcB